MVTAVGYLTRTGVGKETTYGTAVNATQLVPTLQLNIDDVHGHLLDNSLVGSNFQITPELGMVDMPFTWSCNARYTLSNLLLENFFGTLASLRYSLLGSTEGKGLTIASDHVVSVHEARGCKLTQLVMTWGPDGVVYSGAGFAQTLVRTGTENTAAELAALINVDKRLKMAPDLTVRLGIATTALTSGNDLTKVSGGVLTLNRQMVATHVAGTRAHLEPIEDNFLTGTLALTLGRYDTDQYKTWQEAGTILAARLFFDAEASTRAQEWLLPGLTIINAPNPITGPGLLPQTIDMMVNVRQYSYAAATISAVASGSHLLDSANGFPLVYPGATVIITGFTGAVANNQSTTVVSYAAGDITVTGTLVGDAAGETVTLYFLDPAVQMNETA